MADQIFVPTSPESKGFLPETTTAPVLAALETLLVAGGHETDPAVGVQLNALQNAAVIAKPENLTDALACLLVLHSEMFDFTSHPSLCEKVPDEQQRALEALEQRWTCAIRNVAGVLARAGAALPPAFDGFFGLPEVHARH